MIINPSKIFSNPFDDAAIISNNFGRFADDTLAKLKQNNTNNVYDAIIDSLDDKMKPFRLELSQIDTGINILIGKTATLDGFMNDFKVYMKNNYVNIAVALGGEKTEAFREFYPNGKTEYYNITKTKTPTLLDRLKKVGAKYSTELGNGISTKLQGFESQWHDLRKQQLEVKSAIKASRAERSFARREVALELVKIIHFIGNKFPADVEKCRVYFDFGLLYAKHKNKKAKNEVSQ